MKIAVTSQGKELKDKLDLAFGRAPYFIIYDLDADTFEAVDNEQVMNIPQGAGIQAAQHIINRSVGALVSGHVGPNAFKTLTAADVKMYVGAEGTVEEAIKSYKQGSLTEASGPDVEGHWV